DPGLADQHRVVLGAARQHLHDPFDLLLATDDRVELLVARQLREVAAELVEHERAAGLRLAGAAALGRALLAAGVAGQQLDDLLAHAGQVGAQLDEHLRGDALAFADQPEEDVLGADVVVAELQRFAQAQLQDLLGAGCERDVAGRGRATVTDDLLHLGAYGLERDAERLERLGRDALTLVDETEQDVLGADVVVVEQPRLFLRQHDHSSGSIGETFEHLSTTSREQFSVRISLYPIRHRERLRTLTPVFSVSGRSRNSGLYPTEPPPEIPALAWRLIDNPSLEFVPAGP